MTKSLATAVTLALLSSAGACAAATATADIKPEPTKSADLSHLSPTQAPPPGPAATTPAANPAHEPAAPTIKDLVVKHAHDNGIPLGLANAVIKIESRFNPKARNHGAFGLMQIKAGAARNVGFGGSAGALLAPDTNLRFGMKILAQAYRASSGDVCRTLAFYQSGHPVRRFTAAQRTVCARARSDMARA